MVFNKIAHKMVWVMWEYLDIWYWIAQRCTEWIEDVEFKQSYNW